jgi:YebC/PmpR family DNA-binding regulatory protein
MGRFNRTPIHDFHEVADPMAGHSKWANIKHRKARQDAKKGKVWSKCARAIIMAARNGGGDPDTNLTLRYAIDEAKAANMPKDTIEKAVKKGSGELGAENYEAITYEGYGPGGVAVFVEALTDNRNRTAGEVRSLFDRNGGNLGTSGSVAFVFNQRGMFLIDKSKAGEEQIMEAALEAGAEDISDEDDQWQILCDATEFHQVRQAFESAAIEPDVAEITMIPTNTVETTGDMVRKIMNLIDALEDNDDVQKVHTNADIPDEELAALES